jgi:DNA-directed RNA polymerase alpha subunit
MSTHFAEPVLNTPIVDLELSEEFKNKTGQLGFKTLASLLEHQPTDLLKLPGFGYRLLTEYIDFLEAAHLGKYIKP